MPSQSIYDLAIAKQTAKGTAATTATYRLRVAGGTPMPTRTINDLEETGTSRLRAQTFVASVGVEGTPETFVRLPSLGLLLYLAGGAKSVTGAADPYLHTITLANAQPYFTCWRMVGDLLYEKFIDCKVSALTITSEAGSPVRASFAITGIKSQSITLTTFTTETGAATLDDGDPLMHYDGAGAFLVEGTAVSSIERIVLTLANNTALQQGDSVTAYDVSEGMRDISVETTQALDEVAMYNRFHYGTASPTTGTNPYTDPITLTGTNGIDFLWTQVAAAPGPERSLRVQIPKLQVQAVGGYEPGTGGDPLKRTSTYKALAPTSGSALTALVKNGVATY